MLLFRVRQLRLFALRRDCFKQTRKGPQPGGASKPKRENTLNLLNIVRNNSNICVINTHVRTCIHAIRVVALVMLSAYISVVTFKMLIVHNRDVL